MNTIKSANLGKFETGLDKSCVPSLVPRPQVPGYEAIVYQDSTKLQDILPEQSLPVNPVGQSHISVLGLNVPPFRHISSAHK